MRYNAHMDAAVSTIFVGLATVLMSGVVSSYVTFRLNREKDQTVFMRQKAEALYLAADEFGRGFSTHIVTFLPLVKGDVDYNEMLDFQIANPPDKRNGGFETLNMLANIYYPEVLPQLKALLQIRDDFGKFRTAQKQAYKEGDGTGHPWTQKFSELAKEADRTIEALKAAIIKSARRHVEAEHKWRTFTR